MSGPAGRGLRPVPAPAPGRRGRPSRASAAAGLGIVVGFLCLLGLLMVLSASSVEALHVYGGAWLFFQRQLMWVCLGMAALVLVARSDYRRWQRLGAPAVVLCGLLLILVLMPGVGVTAGGSTRWLGFGPLNMQPSELAKLALLVYAADLVARRADRAHEPGAVLRPLLVVGGLLGGLVMLQPDMGTTIILTIIVLIAVFVGGLPLMRMGALMAATLVGGFVFGMSEEYRRARMLSFLDPWADAGNTGYQVSQSLVALGSGRLTGVGLGESRAKWGFLPNAHTDFIYAIIGEELGLVGTILVLALFLAFTVLGVKVALRAPDRFGTLLAAGVTGWVAGQALINMGAVTGRLPVTGVPLPFVSFGGSSLVVTMAAAGLLMSVSRHGARRRAP
ncbi:MAG: putative lipid II flippase FtsW [Actinomycetota bacterium]